MQPIQVTFSRGIASTVQGSDFMWVLHNYLIGCVCVPSSLLLGISSGTAHQMRTMPVYDEVVLPPTTSSSAIPTEPNTAYVTTTMSRNNNITTDHNVAYAAPL